MRAAFCLAAILFLAGVDQLQCAEGLRPAMIGGGADSVAAKLHYPPKERDSKTEAVVVFFCEVAANGRAKNVRTYWNKGYNRFGDAVEKALNQGHFVPAMVEGKPLPVLIGATVFFFARGSSNCRYIHGNGRQAKSSRDAELHPTTNDWERR